MSQFAHWAFFNEGQSRIEMHLVSLKDQKVTVDRTQRFSFVKARPSTRKTPTILAGALRELAQEAGWRPSRFWTDDKQLFSLHLLEHLSGGTSLAARFSRIRDTSCLLCRHLEPEDFVVQTMAGCQAPPSGTWRTRPGSLNASCWCPGCAGTGSLMTSIDYLFNSYYQTAGKMHARPHAGCSRARR